MDAVVIRFKTGLFDVAQEPPNEINPIYGQSLLAWLARTLRQQVSIPTPQSEDWGWYVDVAWLGRKYLLGASASEDEDRGQREWVLQIVKPRSLKEKLLGRERLAPNDELVALVLHALQAEPAFEGVATD